MEMHQVRYFLAMVKYLNFTHAAGKLRVAQPTLTRAIKKLEQELGGILFHRERASTHLTELGRMMLPYLEVTLSSHQEAKKQALSFHKRESGKIVVGACPTTCAGLGKGLLAKTAREMGGLNLHVLVAPAASVQEQLMTGAIDAGLLSFVDGAKHMMNSGRLEFRLIAEDPFVVAFAPGHRFETEEGITLEHLNGEPLIVANDVGYEREIAALMEARGIKRLVRHTSSDGCWLAELVRSGLGFIVCPEAAAQSRGLSTRRLIDVGMTRQLMLVTVAGRRRSPSLALLVQHAEDLGRDLAKNPFVNAIEVRKAATLRPIPKLQSEPTAALSRVCF